MRIAILSGKGGTGKTTISTNLSVRLGMNYLDCDVEAPNGFLFLEPDIKKKCAVKKNYPIINHSLCVQCGRCIEKCQFNALALAGDEILTFPKLCHSCGVCEMVCNYDAITYEEREIGHISLGRKDEVNCLEGRLNIGEPMGVPIIKEMLCHLSQKDDYIIDAPPGTSCSVVNVLRYTDVALLVTEPTAFGLHDLQLAVELVRNYKIPFGVVINKDDMKDNKIVKYCNDENIEIMGRIPNSKEVAICYSKGKLQERKGKVEDAFQKLMISMWEAFQWKS